MISDLIDLISVYMTGYYQCWSSIITIVLRSV